MKFTRQQRAEALKKLARRTPGYESRDNAYRQAHANLIAAPILVSIRKQSSVMSMFTPVQLQPNEQAEFQVEPSVAPSVDKYTGVTTDPLIVYNQPQRGPMIGQTLFSKTLAVPTGVYETESGFSIYTAERALFNFEEEHRRVLANSVVSNIETTGWNLIQSTVSHASFPTTQTVTIAAGQPGAKFFSRQLMGKILRLTIDLGLVTTGGYTPTLWVSNTSFEEWFNWDINTQFDISTPAQIAESLKEQLSQLSGVTNVGSYRGVPIVALRDLGTGDITAGIDYCYLSLKSNTPNGLVLPIRMSKGYNMVTGLEEYFPMGMESSPTSVYNLREVRTKLVWQCGYACLDARVLYTGTIDRT